MFSRAKMALVCVIMLAWSATLTSAETLEDIIALVEKQGATIKDMCYTIKMDMDVMGQKVSAEGEMRMKMPGKMAVETVTRATSQGRRSDVKMKVVTDGEVMWQEVNTAGECRVNRVDLKAAGLRAQDIGMGPVSPGAVNPAKALGDLKNMMDVIVLDDATLPDGQKAWVVEGKFKPGTLGTMPQAEGADAEKMKALLSGMRMYIGQADRLIRRMDFLSGEGEPTGTMSFENMRVNTGLGDEVFAYTPPAGAAVTDMTEMVKKQRTTVSAAELEGAAAREDVPAPERAEGPPAGVLKTGAPAPAFVVETLDGQTVDLAKLRGKPVLVFFWASWHRDSIAMLAEATELVKGLKGREIEVVGISLDEPDALDEVKKLVAEKGITAKVALGTGEIFDAYWVSRVPTYVLVDVEGRALVSEANPKDLAALKKMIEGLLDNKSAVNNQ